jgi:hypothetical protein
MALFTRKTWMMFARAFFWLLGTVGLGTLLLFGFFWVKLDYLIYPLIPQEWISGVNQKLGLNSIEQTTDFEMSILHGLFLVIAGVVMAILDKHLLRRHLR